MLLMGTHDKPRYFKQTWDNLKPDGWIEVQGVQFPIGFADDTVQPDSPLLVWSQHVREAAAKGDIDTMVAVNFKLYLAGQALLISDGNLSSGHLVLGQRARRKRILGSRHLRIRSSSHRQSLWDISQNTSIGRMNRWKNS
jgi:hypothetical protein